MIGANCAFPFNAGDFGFEPAPGLCARDFAAIQILAGMGQWIPERGGVNLAAKEATEARAIWAREQADALMKALGTP